MNVTIYSAKSIKAGKSAIRELDQKKTKILQLTSHRNGTSLERFVRLWIKKHTPGYNLHKEYEALVAEISNFESAGLVSDELSDAHVTKLKNYYSSIERFEETYKNYELKKSSLPEELSQIVIHPDTLRQLETAKTAIAPALMEKAELVGLMKVGEALVFEKSEFLDKNTRAKKLETALKQADEKSKQEQLTTLKNDFALAKQAKESYSNLFFSCAIPFSEDGREIMRLCNSLTSKLGKEHSVWVLNEFFTNIRKNQGLPEVIGKCSLARARLTESQFNFDSFERIETGDLQKCLAAYMQTGLMASYARSSSGATKLVKELIPIEMEIDQVCTILRTSLQYRELNLALSGNALLNYVLNTGASESDVNSILATLLSLKKLIADISVPAPASFQASEKWINSSSALNEVRHDFEEKGRKLLTGLGWEVYSEDNIMAGLDKARTCLLNPNLIQFKVSDEIKSLKAQLEVAHKEIAHINQHGVLAQVVGANPFDKLDDLYKINTLFEVIKMAELPPEHLTVVLSEGNLAQIGVLESIKEKIMEQRALIVRMQNDVGDLFGLPRLKDGLMNVRLSIKEFMEGNQKIQGLIDKKMELEGKLEKINRASIELFPLMNEFYDDIKGNELNSEFVSKIANSKYYNCLREIAEVVLILSHEISVKSVTAEIIDIAEPEKEIEVEASPEPEDLLGLLKAPSQPLVVPSSSVKEAMDFSSIDDMFKDDLSVEPLDLSAPFMKPEVTSGQASAGTQAKKAPSVNELLDFEEAGAKLPSIGNSVKAAPVAVPTPAAATPAPTAAPKAPTAPIPSKAESLFDDDEGSSASKGNTQRASEYLERYNSHRPGDWRNSKRGGR